MTELIVQPTSKDTYISEYYALWNLGGENSVQVYDRLDRIERGLLEFDISAIPLGAIISSAVLELYYWEWNYYDPVGRTVWAYKLSRLDWLEGDTGYGETANWQRYRDNKDWINAGGDYVTSNPSGGSAAIPASYGWVSWNILAIVQDAYQKRNPVEILLKYATEDLEADYGRAYFYSLDTIHEEWRPKLTINYDIPPLTVARKYILEVHNRSGDLLAILENAHKIPWTEEVNSPPILDFRIPADDSKAAYLTNENEIWLRNYETGDSVRKFLISGRKDIRR